jgi:hypothetical protein
MEPGNYPVIKTRDATKAVEAYVAKQAASKALERELGELRETLLGLMAGAPVAQIGKRVLTATDIAEVPPVPPVAITRAMVGTVLPGKGGRKAYTQLRVAA